jgi:hypothetical protein
MKHLALQRADGVPLKMTLSSLDSGQFARLKRDHCRISGEDTRRESGRNLLTNQKK